MLVERISTHLFQSVGIPDGWIVSEPTSVGVLIGSKLLLILPLWSFRGAYSSTAEQGTHNPLVTGSNPVGPTIIH